MGTYLFDINVEASVDKSYREALEILASMEARDGIGHMERVNLRLRVMNIRDRYRMVYKVKGYPRKYQLDALLPKRVTDKAYMAKNPDKVANIAMEFSEHDRDVISVTINTLHTKHDIGTLTLPDPMNGVASVMVAVACTKLIAAEHTRRWKVPFGMKMFPIVRE